jgi:hypothetical protein
LLFEELASACPLKPEIIKDGLDLVGVRSLQAAYISRKRTKKMGMVPQL